VALVDVEADGLLFDMDGVLISSVASAVRCWRAWAKHYGMPGWEVFEVPHGVRPLEIVQRSMPAIDPQEGLKRIEDMEIADTGDIRVLPGAAELLASLPASRWTIVTSAGSRLMAARVKAAELPMPARWIAAESVERGKPDPEPYRRGAELLGFAPERCVVLEDAPSGVQAGIAAGSRVIGVLGTEDEAGLRRAGATWVVESLRDVRVLSGERLKLSINAT
jgi:sugar-phosphatase